MNVRRRKRDVVIVGGGHNALVAAAYLAQAGRGVVVLEATERFGGAAVSSAVFPGVDVRLSRFAYLVSLLPEQIRSDLALRLELRSRRVASYTPAGDSGLLVERVAGSRTRQSFADVTGSAAEWDAWVAFEERLVAVAGAVAPTLTAPLPRAQDMAAALGPDLWQSLTQRPLGELVEASLRDDTVRGVVLTDALIGTHTFAHDPTLRQNRCFLYHVIGNGNGEWRVPVGGMGAVADELERAARRAGAELRADASVTAVVPICSGGARVCLANGRSVEAPYVLAGCAPATLARLLGEDPGAASEGSQLKINLVARRLPRLRSGLDPETGFAGTLHLNQGYEQLDHAYRSAEGGRIPDPLPCEVYCHTLTDRSILGPEPRAAGWHTLTLFGLHTPARLFVSDPAKSRKRARDAALRSLQSALAERLEDCLAVDANGRPCVEVMTPLDVEAELGMPGGHIFHGDLSWPWLSDDAAPQTPAERWGVSTAHPGILICGSGAIRGGAVSGLGGHNAAMAVLESG